MFCTYLTIYSGSKLPRNYVGSSSVERVNNGYHGTVLSERWKETWEKELSENPHLFKTTILTLHVEREEATQEELRFQKENNVVKSEEWINEAYAQPNGFFGRDVSGELNPMYGKGYLIKHYYENLSENEKEIVSEKRRQGALKQWENAEERKKKFKETMNAAGKKWVEENPDLFRERQSKASFCASEKLREKAIHLLFEGSVYRGYGELLRETGVTKWFAKKMIESGEIRVVKNG